MFIIFVRNDFFFTPASERKVASIKLPYNGKKSLTHLKPSFYSLLCFYFFSFMGCDSVSLIVLMLPFENLLAFSCINFCD